MNLKAGDSTLPAGSTFRLARASRPWPPGPSPAKAGANSFIAIHTRRPAARAARGVRGSSASQGRAGVLARQRGH